ncbi:HIT-like protein [Vararia minispora EC-137]|uniref:HIT-like protein n=1 Tax=Vararia minispora EC-137 TaxID=1314806 RepID=A0ACB8QJB2_9AGAM|nr:HIT-like protein [Vararia minispora EC-137]
MTSFVIDAHVGRDLPVSWCIDEGCPFCNIVRRAAPAHRIYEDGYVAAFLDILPLRPGHTLVVPKTHISRVSELPADFAAALGVAVSKISSALTKAMENTALNIVCNQEYAQAVPHVHYHIIPAPRPGESQHRRVDKQLPEDMLDMHRREFHSRNELDDDDAKDIVGRIKAFL